MNIRPLLCFTFICSAAWSADSITALDVKLGQWETTSTTNTTGITAVIPPEVLDKLPTDQRAKIEERIKANQGPHTTVTQNCFKKEELDKAMAFGADDKACTRTILSSSRGKQEIHIECNRQGSKQ